MTGSLTDQGDGHLGYDSVALVAPILERWRWIAGFVSAACVIVVAFVVLQATKYRAEVVVTTVASQRSVSALGGLAATLAGANLQGGVQLTPARMVELMRSRRVALAVGRTPIPWKSGSRVGDELAQEHVPPPDEDRIQRLLAQVAQTTFSKETGTISVQVEYRDSALARLIAERIVKEASEAFVESARAQATQLKLAQTARVDSAARQLTRTETELAEFLGANRVVTPFSSAALAHQRLERNVTFAQQIYTQAVTDREAAVAKELEETPAVVTIDSMPPYLPKVRRHVALKAGLTFLLATMTAVFWVLFGEFGHRRLAQRDADVARLVAAARALPLAGRRLFR
jgi:capsule polysaccharide export protein KpsE/RkpR